MPISHITDTNISITHTADINQTIDFARSNEITNKILQTLDKLNEELDKLNRGLTNLDRRLISIENKQSSLEDKLVELSRFAPIPPPPPPPPSLSSYSPKTHVENNESSMSKKESEANTPVSNRSSSDLQTVPGLLEELTKKLQTFKNRNPEFKGTSSPEIPVCTNLPKDETHSSTNNLRRTQSCCIKPSTEKSDKADSESEKDNKLPTRVKKYPPPPPTSSSPTCSPKTHVEIENSMPRKESGSDASKEKSSDLQLELSEELKTFEIHQAKLERAPSPEIPVCTNTLKGETNSPTNNLRRTQSCRIKSWKNPIEVDPEKLSMAAKLQMFGGIKT